VGQRALATPGLYSWWVDQEGARHLSIGLRHELKAGLIYAGQAGATRWPSGRRSDNTLWARLVEMHINGSVGFSTFRRTLDAILHEPLRLDRPDDPMLNDWMAAHLRVQTWACQDASTLGQVEAAVLAALDPPLNLKGMGGTPLRARLKVLRSGASSPSDEEDG
jgi:hypothetical protein